MRKASWRKGMAICAITIFCSLALTPAIGHLHIVSPEKHEEVYEFDDAENCETPRQELVEIEVTEYKPDGSIDTTLVLLTQSEIETLEERLSAAYTMEKKLSLLKEYRLVPTDASLETMELGMRQIAEKMELTDEKIQNIASSYEKSDMWLPPIILSFFNEVSATFRWGNSLRIGMTPFLRLINRYLKSNINRGVDVIDMCWGMKSSVFTKGWLGEHYLYLEPGCMLLIGFVGYSIKRLFFRHSFYGASVMTFAAGLGSHDFDPWFP